MATQYLSEANYSFIGSAMVENRTPRLTMETVSSSAVPTYSYLPTPDGSVEGLGIVCGPAGLMLAHDSAIDVAFDNSVWQTQIDNEILQFQQGYEQNLCQNSQDATPILRVDASYAGVPLHLVRSTEAGNYVKQRSYDASCATISDSETTSTVACDPCPSAQQNLESFPSFANAAEHNSGPAHHVQPDYTSQQVTSLNPTTQFSGGRKSVLYQDTPHMVSEMSTTPHLRPSADIQDACSRRLSVSSNAPSSVFSSDCQGTPYFMTPSTTPRFTSSMLAEFPCTPMSTLSSPIHPRHSRSLSSTSLKAPTSTFRPIRPAPYTLDAAQRQRWSTGKAMSLPSRHMQPPSFSFSPGHMRAVSEQNTNGMYFDDDFANGDRTSFNHDLEAIRMGIPTITRSAEQNNDQSLAIKTEELSSSLQRPVLAVIQPKILSPLSTLSVPREPPLDLPEQSSRPSSPPPQDLFPLDSVAPTQNPVSPYDAYTPKYKRGTKGQLEGFCGLCKPGRWLNMKNSRYWYDKNYNHGINSKTRKAFDLPVDRRFKMGHSVIREGLCGVCNRWIDMDSCRMSWKHWWKHAYKVSNFMLSIPEIC